MTNMRKGTYAAGGVMRIVTLALLCAVTLFSVFVLFFGAGFATSAQEAPAQTYTIHTAQEFIEYSRAYATGERNHNDVLNISINEGSVVTDDGFVSIGTSEYPFSGTINIPSAGVDVFHLFDCPLFDYVSTDLTLTGTGSGTVKIMREKASDSPADGVLTSGALFANHVVAGSRAANWSISLLAYDGEGTESPSFTSLFGDIAAGADVTVSFANTANIPVSNTGNAGLICGTLGSGASLTVSTSGSGSAITVTSVSGNAGSLVGEMQNGATLTLASDNNTRVNRVTATNGYAGGVVGKADNITVDYATGVTDYAISGNVTGKAAAGGVFGRYICTAAEDFTMEDTFAIASGTAVSSTNYAGGVFGLLENNGTAFTFDGNDAGETITVTLSGGKYRGGVCGAYTSSALTNSLEISDTATAVTASTSSTGSISNYSAGLIGTLLTTPSYVNIHDVTCSASGSPNAGLVGTAGSGGSFIDVTGNVTVRGTFDAGLVADMPQGVLRLSGDFDLTGYVQFSASSGYLVKERNRALVYALGDSFGTAGNWTFTRSTNRTVDDIHAWGQVLRLDGSKLRESDLLTVDMTAHTVTVAPAVTNMTTVTDFAKTALNIKLNTGAGVGALQFTSGSANLSSTLLSGTLSLSGDIALTGTGLTGLTRDDGANAAFSGTFNGNNHSITFATGENYGLKEDGGALDASSRQGFIFQHGYNGLFAKTSNATVKDLTLLGQVNIQQTANNVRLGGVTAYATDGLLLDNVTTAFAFKSNATGDYTAYYAGAIGVAAGSGLDVTIQNSDIGFTYQDISTVGGSNTAFVGGAIGLLNAEKSATYPSTVEYTSNQNVTFTSSDLSLTYNKTGSAARASVFGAAIANVTNCIYGKDNRQITFDDVDVDIDVTGGRAVDRKFGGILGTDWYAADVTIDDVRVDADIAATSGAADFGGLVRTATGRWDVKQITLNSANFTLPSTSGSTFGFVANKTSVNGTGSAKSALYLDVNNKGNNYDIAALSITGPTFTVFDEIVADSRFNGGDIVGNGNSIISITTSDDIIHTSGSYNTYLNKTAYGRQASAKINPNTRYYYNIDYARANTATAKYNYLVWSVKTYAHSSLADWFDSSSTFTGDLDMRGLSYYPVDLSGGVTFNNATLTLDNNLMEDNVKYAYTGADGRTTRSNTNQHYLMHTAAFRNDSGSNISITGGSGLTIRGNVPKLSDGFCGFLVAGMLGNSDTKNVRFNASNIVLDGAHIITDTGADLTTSVYAPVLINKVGKNTSVTVSAAKQSETAYTSYAGSGIYAGSSLIGDVGSATARAIYLSFEGLKFDGRSTATSIGNMDTAYGTTKSIFSRATILNSFLYSGESSGSYTYEITADWNSSGNAIHNVTYGKEVTTSVEFANKQKKYYGSAFYTHPTAYESTAEYDFSTGFLPYVYTAYNLSEYKRELAVNVTFESEIQGCGKYNDPFIIDDDEKLPIISRIINGQNVGESVKLYLPNDLTSFNYTKTNYTKYAYNFGTENFTSSTGGSAITNPNARRYLAGAYYVITKDIELPNDYVALGTVDNNNNPQYAFRGVLIGRNITVTNHSRSPLIHTSLGSVVKDITITVDVDYNDSNLIEIAAPLGTDTYNYIGGIQSYGAVIGQILGGDTIIDNTQVEFESVSFSITAATSSNYPRLAPIGGYVGTHFGGALIFRNMSSSNVGLTAGAFDKVSDAGYLYVNPIIGRVVNGYAFHELSSGAYNVVSTALDNGSKNYTIPDLSKAAGKITVTDASSRYTISVPDGQSVYILGAVVNSGAACAETGGNITNSIKGYNTLSDLWQAYRAHTTVRGGADYSGVGSSSGADFDKASLDSYTASAAKIPYVVRAYTADDNSCLYLRSLTRRTNNIVKLTGDCDVPAGFRGIGHLYLNSDYTRLTVQSVTGATNSTPASYTVTLHMDYRQYEKNNVTAYQSVANTAGFGLFNVLKMNGASATNCVENIELSGSVFYDIYTINGTKSQYLCGSYNSGSNTSNVTTNQVNADEYLSVGGLAGLINSAKYYIQDVTFNDLSVEGAKSAGGLIGYVNMPSSVKDVNYIRYTSTATNRGAVNVSAGLSAGGLIGRIYMAKTDIAGDSGSALDLIVGTIELKSQSLDGKGTRGYVDNQIIGVGGVIGSLWSLDKEGNGTLDTIRNGTAVATSSKPTYINYLNVVKGTNDAVIRVKNDTSSVTALNMAGGFVGLCHNTILHIKHCKLTDVDIKANLAGGLVGMLTQKYFVHIDDIEIDGNNSHTITGRQFAGGVVGRLQAHDERYIDINGVTVKQYTIESPTTGNSANCAAGGLIGAATGDNRTITNFIDCEIRNTTVQNCTIRTKYTSNSSNTGCGTGGLIGASTVKNNYKMHFDGYNLLVSNVTLSHLEGGTTDQSTSATNNTIGDVIGNNVDSTLKLAGVTTVNTPYCGKHAGKSGATAEAYGSNGYIVFADFDATQTNTAFAAVDDASVNTDDYVNVDEALPYVTANPSATFGGITLTSDGIGTSVETLPIQSIVADTASGRYAYAAAAHYQGSSGDTNFVASATAVSKLAMFRSEVSDYIGTDFPVLVLDDTTRETSHKMINSYLRMLTNTKYDFGTDQAGVYEVQIYNMTYSDHFTASTTGASLKRAGGQFYMLNSQFDSGKTQFSLIDIRFFDPSVTSSTAYHLYVPVFVKKVLSFSFDIAQLSGTTYLDSQYTPRFGQALIENTGTPITLYFRYTYSRTAEEWAQSINAGEDVNRNYEKSLLFYKANTNDLLKAFPGETVLTLVDANDNNKPYYATLSTAFSGNRLNLSAFKETMTADGQGGYTFSGSSFTPQTLQTLMTLTAARDNANGTLVTCAAADATVIVSGQGYRAATDEELADSSTPKYTVSVSDVRTEDYYLSVYTESNAVNDELFHYFLITTPSTFSDALHPSKITDTGAHTMVHLVMGKIFYHSGLEITSTSATGSPIMTAANNLLVIDMTAEFGLSDDLDSDIKADVQNLIAATDVFQSYIVYLNRKENLVLHKEILGNPDAAGTYAVDYVLNGVADAATTAYTSGTINVTQNCAEFITGDLSDFFASGNHFEIDASVTLTYSADAIPTQFPGRADIPPADSNGVTLSGASHIAFQQNATTYSKTTIDVDEFPANAYYSESPPEVATLDLNPIGDRVGDFTPLGINALNNNDLTVADFDLLADLNIGPIADRITNYTDAVVTVQVAQKQMEGGYGEMLDITQYMTVDIDGLTGMSSDEDSYYRTIDRSALTENAAIIELPVIHCHVTTGADLESLGFTYGNYKITVTVVLRENAVPITISQASNYVIYTNAKIVPEFIS